MAWTVDARVPVVFGDATMMMETDAALLDDGSQALDGYPVERFTPTAQHVAGCACCSGRSSAALGLDRLFQRRARGEIAFFRRVVVVATTPEAELEVWAALRSDAVASARFRHADPAQPGKS